MITANLFIRATAVFLPLWAAGAARGQDPAQPPARRQELGSRIEGFTLRDARGNTVSYESLREPQGKGQPPPILVICFWSTRCPLTRELLPSLEKTRALYEPHGVRFVLVMPNASEPIEEIRRFASTSSVGIPVLLDTRQTVTDLLGARTTPQVFIVDRDGVLRYRGGWDNGRTGALAEPWVVRTLDALVAGKGVSEAETKNFGCPIKRSIETADDGSERGER